jgi:hypothetical protein
MFFTASC